MNDLKSTLNDSTNTNPHDIEHLFIEGEMAVEDVSHLLIKDTWKYIYS